MKKTLTINLSGIVFNIDEDAYDVLQEYLKKLEIRFTGEEGKEILCDIEARLAELFGDAVNHKQHAVVTIVHVENAIAQLGTAEEIGGGASEMHRDETSKEERKRNRKFYRDSENKILGGVAAGFAAYLGFDVTIVRLVFVLLAITILGWLIPIYLLVWLIAPEAKTTAQKLEMQGIEPSIENIKEYLNSEKFKESANRIGSRLGEVVKWIFRIVAIVIGLFFIVTGTFVIGVLLVVLLGLLIGGGGMFGAVIGSLMPATEDNSIMITFIVSTLLACIIPIISILIATIRLIRKDNSPRKKGWGWFWFVVWLVSSIVSVNTLALNAPYVVRTLQNLDENDFIFMVDNNIITEERLRDAMFTSIDIDGNLMVELKQDTCNYIEVKSNATNIRNIETIVKNGELKLSLTSPIENLTNTKIIVVHYCSTIDKIDVGSASIVSNNEEKIITDNLELDIESAAVINLGVQCSNLNVDASSAAVVNIWGECDYLEADLSSAAVANLKDLTAGNALIDAASAAVIDAPKCQNIKVEKESGAIVKP